MIHMGESEVRGLASSLSSDESDVKPINGRPFVRDHGRHFAPHMEARGCDIVFY
jgi:hypothetical protein